MLSRILNAVGLLGETPRSSRWPALERAFLREHPECAACGTRVHLQVHHEEPFALYPAKELDWGNLITLCMGPNECHFRIGHDYDWRKFNRHVRRDAAAALAARKGQPAP